MKMLTNAALDKHAAKIQLFPVGIAHGGFGVHSGSWFLSGLRIASVVLELFVFGRLSHRIYGGDLII